jgi:hypothetical protein
MFRIVQRHIVLLGAVLVFQATSCLHAQTPTLSPIAPLLCC